MDFLPMPHSVRKGEVFFVLRYDTRIVLENTEPFAFLYAQMLQADVQRFTGLKPAIQILYTGLYLLRQSAQLSFDILQSFRIRTF